MLYGVPGQDPARIKVVLADAQPAALAGLSAALDHDEFAILAAVGTADELVAAVISRGPDVCLVDADLPGDALGATARVVRERPETAVVVLARDRGDAPMLDAVRAGASGYLLKDMDPERLRFAIRGVTEGEAALPRRLVTRLMEEVRKRGGGRLVTTATGERVSLTAREWDVLELLADGASTEQVARTLAISTTTVRRHVSGAMGRLGVRERSAAIAAVADARRG